MRKNTIKQGTQKNGSEIERRRVCNRETKAFRSEEAINNIKDKNKLTLIHPFTPQAQ